MIELKRCPFCGGETRIVKLEDDGYAISHIVSDERALSADCPIAVEPDDNAGIIGVWCWDTEAEAAAAWNRRVGDETEDDLK